jgi:allophanate hydrolase
VNTQPQRGWTLAEWQAAYQGQGLEPECLFEFVAQFPSPDPAWIARVDADGLRQQLGELAQRLKTVGSDRSKLPLYGVPFAVKDNIDAAGFETTAACSAFAYRAPQDADVVARLRAQGAIVVGKTNMDQFATGLVGTRSPYGVVTSSFDERYIAGGSSSGSASVVARGLVPFALGTDTAGSGRVPAAFNNIVGWKPTRGAWSTCGVVPACRTLDCVSVFTLTVTDARALAQLSEGFDPLDPYSRQRPASIPSPSLAKPDPALRLAIPDQLDFAGDAYAEAAFRSAIAKLEEIGAQIQPLNFTPFKELARLLYEGPWVAERLTVVEPLLLTDPEQVEPVVRSIVHHGKDFAAVQAFRFEYQRASLARAIALALEPFDALVVPTTPTTFSVAEVAAEPIKTNSRLGTYTNFTNLADLCGLAVPGPFRGDGLPAGITLLAPAWQEATLATLGAQFEAALALPRGATRRPFTPAPVPPSAPTANPFDLAVMGAHLSGLALNPQLQELKADLVKATRTSAKYRLYLLPNTAPLKPGMMREAGGGAINVEVWRLSAEAYARFIAAIPSPLGIGNIELEDGTWVKGFLCEAFALKGATEITRFGGFRQYLEQHS